MRRPHGVRGALKAAPRFDGDPATLLGRPAWLISRGGAVRATELVAIDVAAGEWRLHFPGIDSPEVARAYSGAELVMEAGELPTPSIPYRFELVGFAVVDAGGAELGEVRAVIELPAGDALVLDDDARRLIPFRPMVVEVDRARRRIVVDLPPGLLDVNA